MNWKCLFILPLVFIPLQSAWAGAADGELTCKSESGKVELNGIVPVDTNTLDLKLIYGGKTIAIGNQNETAHLIEDLRKGVFTFWVKRERGDDLELYALPQSVVDLRVQGSQVDFKFDAKLTAPRPGGPFRDGGYSAQPLLATLKCTYHYSI